MISKQSLIIAGLLLTSGVFAQGLIALQSGENATFYTNLDSALYYAKDGDDIYLPGGNIKCNATNLNIGKAVNIKGVGYNPFENPATLNTIIESGNINIMPNVNGGSISGIFAKSGYLRIGEGVSNFIISRCFFDYIYITGIGAVFPSNLIITETVVNVISGNHSANPTNDGPINILISNCIIGRSSSSSSVYISTLSENLKFKNSIFIGGYQNSSLISKVKNSVFENCILINLGIGPIDGGYPNTFINCLTNSSSEIFHGNTTLFNCIFDQSPESIFIDPQGIVFNMKNDFRLQESSPGKNAGSDGTDIGIYGGRFPWKDGGLPINPHIESKFVNGTTNHDGTLDVKIKVAAQER